MYSRWIAKLYDNEEAVKLHLRRVALDLLAAQGNLRLHDYGRWLRIGPCPGCPCEQGCDHICALRALWWDDFRREVRR